MSARAVRAFFRLAWLADEVADVMRAVIVGPPSRAVVRRDFELPGPVELERGDVERLVGQSPRKTLTAEARARLDAVVASYAPAPPGLVPCARCGTEQAPRDGRMTVHFPTREAVRPCVGSWPVKVQR